VAAVIPRPVLALVTVALALAPSCARRSGDGGAADERAGALAAALRDTLVGAGSLEAVRAELGRRVYVVEAPAPAADRAPRSLVIRLAPPLGARALANALGIVTPCASVRSQPGRFFSVVSCAPPEPGPGATSGPIGRNTPLRIGDWLVLPAGDEPPPTPRPGAGGLLFELDPATTVRLIDLTRVPAASGGGTADEPVGEALSGDERVAALVAALREALAGDAHFDSVRGVLAARGLAVTVVEVVGSDRPPSSLVVDVDPPVAAPALAKALGIPAACATATSSPPQSFSIITCEPGPAPLRMNGWLVTPRSPGPPVAPSRWPGGTIRFQPVASTLVTSIDLALPREPAR
jgi:hypothetical protein